MVRLAAGTDAAVSDCCCSQVDMWRCSSATVLSMRLTRFLIVLSIFEFDVVGGGAVEFTTGGGRLFTAAVDGYSDFAVADAAVGGCCISTARIRRRAKSDS